MSLKEMCLQLPLEARTELCKFLLQSIIDEKRTGYQWVDLQYSRK